MKKDGGGRGCALNRFDAAAATWEENPARQALTAAVLKSLAGLAPSRSGQRVLEYGCGTAALGRALATRAREVVAMDASPGMIAEAAARAAAAGLANLRPVVGDLTSATPEPELGRFDCIVTAMALHHVVDPLTLLRRLAGMLTPGGFLAVADLEAEDGTFHAGDPAPHNGFDPTSLRDLLASEGLEEPRWVRAHEVPKHGRTYPVFLLVARRPRLKVLFLCTGNSCRSQMAEGWAAALRVDAIDPRSAGIEAHGLNPLAVRVMAEAGVDISGHRSKTAEAVAGVPFDCVVTVCGHAHETCPAWLGRKARIIHAGFDDPPTLAKDARTEEEALQHYRRVRDEIRAFVLRMPGILEE